MDRPGFAVHEANLADSYFGMDVDYCRSLAAALFGGEGQLVDFVEIDDVSSGYALLANDEIDVLAGAIWTLETDVREPTTGKGYSFSQPYFYGYNKEEDNLCLATRQEDKDWSKLVYWHVSGTIYAEENNITSTSFNAMPEVSIFGQSLNRVFKDSMLAMGSYGEMYERNLEPLYPRGGRNTLNAAPHFGPQHYALPGFGF